MPLSHRVGYAGNTQFVLGSNIDTARCAGHYWEASVSNLSSSDSSEVMSGARISALAFSLQERMAGIPDPDSRHEVRAAENLESEL